MKDANSNRVPCAVCDDQMAHGLHYRCDCDCHAIPNRTLEASREFLFGPFGEKSAAEEADATRNRGAECEHDWSIGYDVANGQVTTARMCKKCRALVVETKALPDA